MKNYINCHIKNMSMERKESGVTNEHFSGIWSFLSITRIPLFSIIHYGVNVCEDCKECNKIHDQFSARST